MIINESFIILLIIIISPPSAVMSLAAAGIVCCISVRRTVQLIFLRYNEDRHSATADKSTSQYIHSVVHSINIPSVDYYTTVQVLVQ